MGTDPKSKPGGYRGIETVLRDAAQVERFLELLETQAVEDEPMAYVPEYEDNDPPGTEYVKEPPADFLDMLTGLVEKQRSAQ